MRPNNRLCFVVLVLASASAPSACAARSSSADDEWRVEAIDESIRGLWTEQDEVFAVGSAPAGGAIVHWDGRAWRRIEKPEAQVVVSGSGASDVWVGGRGAVLHYTGASWSMPYKATGDVLSLAALSGELWLGGERTRIEDREGHAVTSNLFHLLDGTALAAVDCCGSAARIEGIWASGGSGGGEVWVLDRGQPVRFDGRTWTRPARESEVAIHRVWGTSSRDVWLVGQDFVVEHWDGEGLHRVAMPFGARRGAFNDVTGTGPHDVWAVGTSGVVVRYDGEHWSMAAVPTTADLRAVHVGARLWVGGQHVIASRSRL